MWKCSVTNILIFNPKKLSVFYLIIATCFDLNRPS